MRQREQTRPWTGEENEMTTVTYVGHGAIDIRPSEPTEPGAGEVQIAVAYTGICGTDLHILRGHMDHRSPTIIGHEMSGWVSAVGEGVDGFELGDAVTVMPLAWCGECRACRDGNNHICQNLEFVGIDSPGAMQTSWNAPANLVIPLPAEISLRDAALVEPVAVAVHDVTRSRLTAGERAVIIGGGPIGALIGVVARDLGAEVLVIEVDRERQANIAALGFSTINPLDVDQVEWVERWSDGDGADVVFEVSGSAPGILVATSLSRVRGRVVVVGIHAHAQPLDLPRVFWRELEILGARVYTREDFVQAIQLISEGTVPVDAIVSRVVPLENTLEAFEALESGKAMKILIDCRASERV